MATPDAELSLPDWIWGGDIKGFLKSARLRIRRDKRGAVNVLSLDAYERRRRPGLIESAVAVTTKAAQGPGYWRLPDVVDTKVEREVWQEVLQDEDLPDEPAPGSDLPTLVNYIQTQLVLADSDNLGDLATEALKGIQRVRLENSREQAFSGSSVLIIWRDPAILHRLKLGQLMLRLQHDGNALREQAYRDLQQRSGLVFASSEGLARGTYLMEAYLAPILAARSPGVWGFPVHKGHGTLIFSYGRPASGTSPIPRGLLDTLQKGLHPSGRGQSFAEFESVDAPEAALTWWADHLDQMFAVITDPGTYAGADGIYAPVVAVQAQLSIEQVFARTASALLSHDDPGSRLPTAFTVIDTLHSLTSIDPSTLFDHSHATKTLRRLQAEIPRGAGEILLPAAERGVEALRAVQDGFFLKDGPGNDQVTIAGRATSLATAAAQYVVELRNATHGFTTTKTTKQQRLRDLLTKHDGDLDSELGLLAWLYLLDLMNQPERLRRCVRRYALASGR